MCIPPLRMLTTHTWTPMPTIRMHTLTATLWSQPMYTRIGPGAPTTATIGAEEDPGMAQLAGVIRFVVERGMSTVAAAGNSSFNGWALRTGMPASLARPALFMAAVPGADGPPIS